MAKGRAIEPVAQGYHGTREDIKRYVVPGGRGRRVHPGYTDPSLTYFVPRGGAEVGAGADVRDDRQEDQAWSWSIIGQHDRSKRQRVYVTEPLGPQHIDKNVDQWSEGGKETERVARLQKVVDTRWAPPAESYGRNYSTIQQTLPHINWNQFGAPNWVKHLAQSVSQRSDEEHLRGMTQYNEHDDEGGRLSEPRLSSVWNPLREEPTKPTALPQKETLF